jgi:hypothetical protein
LSGSISLNHLSICYNSLVLITLVFRSSCRITYICWPPEWARVEESWMCRR